VERQHPDNRIDLAVLLDKAGFDPPQRLERVVRDPYRMVRVARVVQRVAVPVLIGHRAAPLVSVVAFDPTRVFHLPQACEATFPQDEGVRHMRFVNGMLNSATTLAVLATGMYVVNFTARSFAARRLAEQETNLTAEALLLGF
jgi:hypothetical protein